MEKLSYSMRLRINAGTPFFGPGVMRILLLVDETGSLQTAAATMNMAYSKAWRIIKTAEKALGFSLMLRHTGGSGGGSSELTEQGRDFLRRYAAFEKETAAVADTLFQQYFGGLE